MNYGLYGGMFLNTADVITFNLPLHTSDKKIKNCSQCYVH